MSKPTEITGGCLCESVRYTIKFPANHDWDDCVGTCQCTYCRKVTGALFFRFYSIPKECVEFTASSTLQNYEATPGKRRGFCTKCGSYLYYSGITSKNHSLAVGCFDEQYLKEFGPLLTKEGAVLYCKNEIPGVTDHLRGDRFETVPEE
ncbi:hypothetical protein VHEMI01352 [[Torrubiella] hemipterigena]|uniref:CENP-V/GFA domain-containing protein n=1 Tax=[Torrubiella] hemipterigena TaxID=1531966 RepID=A0A0A1T573_9HYPO|nr:hypothetical protein VHEMI01352 [[Torrubiella] hemipterigena]